MTAVGIEAMNLHAGGAALDLKRLAAHRGMDPARFENLLIREKSVAMPHEDPVTYAVNAARPIVEALPEAARDRIEMLVCCTESGLDFGKSLSTYVHKYLGLGRNCRLFEIKQACYSGTAGLQTGINFVLSQASPGAKALVIATDVARVMVAGDGEKNDSLTMDWEYFEPSGGAGAVAVLVGETPEIFRVDVGANGYYGFEVMDTCRPIPDSECGNADLSLLSYLDCCNETFLEYKRRVPEADYRESFQYLCFHTPFGGMVKGAHRTMMRKHAKVPRDAVEPDFEARVQPALTLCQRVGNIMGATVLMSLASAIDQGEFETAKRIGCFSYGSGCCSEFYSGVTTPAGHRALKAMNLEARLSGRHDLTIPEYETVLAAGEAVKFGTRNLTLDPGLVPAVLEAARRDAAAAGEKRLYLSEIKDFYRQYDWL